MPEEPSSINPAEALAFMQKQMEDHGALTNSEVLHAFYGLIEAIGLLNARPVELALQATNEQYRYIAAGGAITDLFPDQGDGFAKAIDWMSDTYRDGYELLGNWLLEHELHDGVDLIVYLPCHEGFAMQSFKPKAGER